MFSVETLAAVLLVAAGGSVGRSALHFVLNFVRSVGSDSARCVLDLCAQETRKVGQPFIVQDISSAAAKRT